DDPPDRIARDRADGSRDLSDPCRGILATGALRALAPARSRARVSAGLGLHRARRSGGDRGGAARRDCDRRHCDRDAPHRQPAADDDRRDRHDLDCPAPAWL
ncbi:MAG: Msl1536 protein, partial [uncultured Thermomicrobiales bacterium]